MIFELNYEVDIEAKEEEQDVTANNPAVEGEDNLARPQVSLMDIIRNNPQLSIPNAQPVPNQNVRRLIQSRRLHLVSSPRLKICSTMDQVVQ